MDPGRGALQITVPAGTVPGEIPIQAAFTLNGTWMTYGTYHRPPTPPPHTAPEPGTTSYSDYGVYGTVTFGYIGYSSGPGNGIVLEDGRNFSFGDFAAYSGTSPYASYGSSLLSTYGVSGTASSTQISSDGTLLWAVIPTNNFSSSFKTNLIAPAGFPSGFNSSADGVQGTNYDVIADKHLIRVYAEVRFEGNTIALPVYFGDQFGHWVNFAWSYTNQGLPSGMVGAVKVDVKNQRSQGVEVRWAEWADSTNVHDLLRMDFLNFEGPSMLIRGYSGLSGTLFGAGDTETIGAVSIGGMIGRPTSLIIGDPLDNTLTPTWAGTGTPAILAPPPLPSVSSGLSPFTWTFNFDPASTAFLQSMTDPRGMNTAFTYTTYSIGCNANAPTKMLGVSQVVETDASGNSQYTHTVTWDRNLPGPASPSTPWTVVCKDWWNNGGTTPTDRKTTYTYASMAASAVDYGNSFLSSAVLADNSSGATIATTSIQSDSGSGIGLGGRGLDGSLSVPLKTTIARQGETTQQVAYSYQDVTDLQTSGLTKAVMVGQTFVNIQSEGVQYNPKWPMLEGNQANQVQTTRIDVTSGTPVNLGTVKTTNRWDAGNLLQLNSTYLDGGNAYQHGVQLSFDSQGRLYNRSVFHVENGTTTSSATSPIQSVTITYDGGTSTTSGTGQPLSSQTQYSDLDANGNAITTTIGRSSSNFDGGNRPQTSTDERGVSTTTTFDLFGRPSSVDAKGTLLVTLTYPDPWTATSTQGSLKTTRHFDGFGRLIGQDNPDGTALTYSYDLHGRPYVTTKKSTQGNSICKTTQYDLLDRPVQVTDFDGTIVSSQYAAGPNGTNQVTQGFGTGPNLTYPTVTLSDAFGQVVKVIAPNGDTTQSWYDTYGHLIKIQSTDAASGIVQSPRTFSFADPLGRLVSKSEPETGSQTFSEFNALNQPTVITEAGDSQTPSRVRTLAMDGLGRLRAATATYNGTTATNTYVYNNLTQLQDAQSTWSGGVTDSVTQHYDYLAASYGAFLQDVITTQTGLTSQTSYTYTDLGAVQSITYPSGRVVTYGVDSLERITSITSAMDGATQNIVPTPSSSPFDQWGNRTALTFQSGAKDTWTPDGTNARPGSWIVTPTQGSPLGWGYTYEPATGRLNGTGEWSFNPDSLGRLNIVQQNLALSLDAQGNAQTSASNLLTCTLNFDGFGNNVTSGWACPGTVPAFLSGFRLPNPSGSNQLSGNGTVASYDPFGDCLSFPVAPGANQFLDMGWDPLGRLISVNQSVNGDNERFSYSPSGLRISRSSSLNPELNRVYSYSASGNLLTEFESGAELVQASEPLDIWTNSGNAILVADSAGWAGQFITVPCAPGDAFYAKAFARFTATTPGSTHIWFRFDSDTQTGIGWGQNLPDGTAMSTNSLSRTQIGAMGIAPNNSTKVMIYIECQNCSPGDMASYDSIEFTKGTPPAEDPAVTNLWTNGSAAVLSADSTGSAGLYLTIPCVSGDTFYASANARFTGPTPGNTHIWFRFDSDTQAGIGWGQILPGGVLSSTNSTARTQIGAMGIAPIGSTKALIYIELQHCNPGDTASFDGIISTKGASIAPSQLASNIWTNGSTALLVADSTGSSGQYLTVPCAQGDTFFAQAFARFGAPTPGNTHVWFRFDSINQPGIGWGQNLPNDVPTCTSSTSRTQIGAMGIAPSGSTKALIYIESQKCNSGDVASYDGIIVTKGAPPASPSTSSDIWTGGSNTVLKAGPTGSAGQYISVPCTSGDILFAQAFARFSASTPGNAHIWFRFDSAQPGIGWGQALPDGTPMSTNSTSRTRIGSMGIAPSGTTKVLIYIELQGCNSGDISSFDNIAFTKGTSTAGNAMFWNRDVIYLDGRAIAEIDGNGTHELHCDHLGTPRVITDGAYGTTEGTQTFGPFGELLNQEGYLPLTGYTGHLQTEPNGLIYMRGRFYSPQWHRFLNSDQGADQFSLNQFAYCGGNPMMATDPSGMMMIIDDNGHYGWSGGYSADCYADGMGYCGSAAGSYPLGEYGPGSSGSSSSTTNGNLGCLHYNDPCRPDTPTSYTDYDGTEHVYIYDTNGNCLNNKPGIPQVQLASLVLLLGWHSDLSNLQAGHWAAALPYVNADTGDIDYKIILSQFPEPRFLVGENTLVDDLTQLCVTEGGAPSVAALVAVPNINGFISQAAIERSYQLWTAPGVFGTQCTVAVTNCLIAGGAPIMASDGSTPFRWPNGFIRRINWGSGIFGEGVWQ